MDIFLKYFPQLTDNQLNQYNQAVSLYKEWNEKINVISRKDTDAIAVHHLLHSLGIAKIHSFRAEAQVLDIGTGGGFPGIPLAIMFPETQFFLVDSIGKKIKVVTEIAQALKLKNVIAKQSRAENLTEKFDFIVSRAVTQMPEFVKWTKGKFKTHSVHQRENGILYLKGGDLTEELKSFKYVEEYLLKDFFEEDFFETKKVIYLPAHAL